jgi:ribosomal protein S18 acetylase RimI-like enzyme
MRPVYRQPVGTWWQECVRGPVELAEFRLEEKGTGTPAGRCTVWEMETFSQRWNEHAIGLVDVEIRQDLRRQGLARFLLGLVLRHFHDQYFTLAEMQVNGHNEPAARLLQGLGFTQVDSGQLFRAGG